MKKFNFTLLTVLLVAGLATAAFGWGGGPGGHGRGPGFGPCGGGGMDAYAQLNLTAEQTEKIQAIQQAELKALKPIHDQMFIKRGDLKLLWLEKTPDPDKIAAAQKELRNLRDQMEDKMTAKRLAILKILTPEQQSKFQSSRGMRMGMGMGPRHGMGPGPEGCPRLGGPRGN